jgi:hypothetical protein
MTVIVAKTGIKRLGDLAHEGHWIRASMQGDER